MEATGEKKPAQGGLDSFQRGGGALITREMVGAGLRWLDSDDPAGAVKDVFEEMMKVVCATPELRLAYLALLSESAQQGSAARPA